MDEILMLTTHADDSDTIRFAWQFARQNGKQLVVAQIDRFDAVHLSNLKLVPQYVGEQYRPGIRAASAGSVSGQVNGEPLLSALKKIDASGFNENMLVAHIRRQGYSMIISEPQVGSLNLQAVVNQINCPLMLLPDTMVMAEIKRIAYLTDLRYCQQQVLSYLDKFKSSSVLLAHICEKGLPDLVQSYGTQLFNDTIKNRFLYPELFFSHIKEANFKKMIDTLINTMRTDILVCLNRRFHFQQLLGEVIPARLPGHITVPLLIFPC